MFLTLVYATIAVCLIAAVFAYFSENDVFHPAIIFAGLCLFSYGYMPYSLTKDDLLFTYVTHQQAEFCQTLALIGVSALMVGCFVGPSLYSPSPHRPIAKYSRKTLALGAYILGAIGLGCWFATIHGAGGIVAAFGKADGAGWSDYAYIRDGIYLLVVGLILLITPQAMRYRDWIWYGAVFTFTVPWVIQGLLGARRGPTFVIAATLAMTWYLARRTRPSLPLMLGGAFALGCLMLFLVTNRGNIYIGSDFTHVRTDITSIVTDANASNEYIFGIGCIETANKTNHYFWGKRYLAQIVVRPIPHQIWPNKYVDFGVPELLRNAGVAGFGMTGIMGWTAVPGAAAAMIADLWVEFCWLMIPVLFIIGCIYSYIWKRAVTEGGPWNSQYTIIAVLAVYLVTQSGEAVIFRLLILTVPTRWVWYKAQEVLVFQQARRQPQCAS